MGTSTLRREDGRIVCERCVVADRAHRRMRGLMAGAADPGQGMVIRRVRDPHALHALPDRRRLPRLGAGRDRNRAQPAAMADGFVSRRTRGRRARSRECDQRGLEVGDRVAWASRSAADARADDTGSLWDDALGAPWPYPVASRDPRFVKLARFLFEGRDLEVERADDAGAAFGCDPRPGPRRRDSRRRRRRRGSAAEREPLEGSTTRDPDRDRRRDRWPEPDRHSRVRPLERDGGALARRRATARRAGPGTGAVAGTGGGGVGTEEA